MTDIYLVSFRSMATVCFFSLAWLLVGIVLGQRISRAAGTPRRKAAGGKQSLGRSKNGEVVELYVGNLSYDISENDLRKTFKTYGDVVSIRLITNKFNGKSKGYGFVEMAHRPESDVAIKSLNNTEIKGRRIIVNEAKSSARN